MTDAKGKKSKKREEKRTVKARVTAKKLRQLTRHALSRREEEKRVAVNAAQEAEQHRIARERKKAAALMTQVERMARKAAEAGHYSCQVLKVSNPAMVTEMSPEALDTVERIVYDGLVKRGLGVTLETNGMGYSYMTVAWN